MVKSVRSALGMVAAAAVVAGCGGSDDPSSSAATKSSDEPVTINWWHIQNNDPMKTIWADAAKQYMADHPNVTIKITVLENEAFKSKLTTTMQGGKPPDMFQSWGGGTLNEQEQAGLIQDVSAGTAGWIDQLNPAATGLYQIDGKQYGVPFNLGMVGLWYRKSLFEKAGIDAPPATWAEFLDDVGKLQDAGVTPLAIGGKDKWPGMFWWANLSLRIAGMDALAKAGEDGSFDAPGFVRGRRGAQEADRHEALPGRLPGRAVGRRGRRGRDHGQRSRGDGPDGPVGAFDVRRQHRGRRQGARRPRLVPVPHRRRRRRAGQRAVRRR